MELWLCEELSSEPDTFCLQVVAWRFLFLFLFSFLFLYMGGLGLFLDPPVSLPGAGRCAEKFVASFPDFRLGAPLQSTAARALGPLVFEGNRFADKFNGKFKNWPRV